MVINGDTQENKHSFDLVKWILVAVLLIVAIVGNYYFRQYNFISRFIAVISIIFLAFVIALWTEKGKATVAFTREARIEIYKVVWPTHQETLQTTLIVALVTSVIALILLGIDTVLVHFISFATRLRF